MADVEAILKRNVAAVEERIAAACRRAGRARDGVLLVGITKYVDAGVARVLHQLGVENLGESRPQELWVKAAAVPEAHWHLVGHLQRNKVEKTLPAASLIHSVDSVRLLEAIDAEAGKRGRNVNGLGQNVNVLLEFNLSGEANKHGFAANEVESLPAALEKLTHVRALGLMTMAALGSVPEQARPTFAALRELRDRLRARSPAPDDLRHLSMGMTGDFGVAIEEGATIVRIGSALFEGLEMKA